MVELQAVDRWQAIEELIGHLVADGKISLEHRAPITESVKKRERSMSTGIGFGIAIPHASTDLVKDVVRIFGRSKNGIDFVALDGKPVHKVALFLVPQGEFQKHTHQLAELAKQMHRKDFRDGFGEDPGN
jgi:PTS system nitrogen regulatory IIA component